MSSETPQANLYTALLAAQRAMGPVKKNAINPHLKSKYADLGAVLDAIEGPLWDNGLLIVQRFTHDQGGAILVTEVVHAASGERLTSAVPVVSKDPTDPQKIGAAITYYRRYSLLALLGLAPEDDDGNAASRPAPPRAAAEPRPGTAPPAAPEPAAVALTDAQERVIAQAWEMAENKDGYPAVIALLRTVRADATPEQWEAIKIVGWRIQQKHYPKTTKAAQQAAG